MKTVFHPENERGGANHGWLKAKHSFSFASWQNRNRMNFGALRVLNDDVIAAKMGFGTHPHENMEIITIPHSGSLKHKDSMGHEAVFSAGEIQVMSAGSGVYHSEFNASEIEELTLFQLWIFPNKQNVSPRYQQKGIEIIPNTLSCILQPEESEKTVWIHQNAYMYIAEFTEDKQLEYTLHGENQGAYCILMKGEVNICEQQLLEKDAIGVSETNSFTIKAKTNSKLLIIEVPMIF